MPFRKLAIEALKTIRHHNCILDLNTAGYRKGLSTPYPSPWVIQKANEMGIGFCFGDDSHQPHEVGADFYNAQSYLLENGVQSVTILQKGNGKVFQEVVSLGED